MKTYFVALAFAVGAVGAVGCSTSPDESEDVAAASDQALTSWQDVLDINIASAGYINTIASPQFTLRPVRGTFMKMSWPLACNAQFSQMALYGASLAGQRLPLAAALIVGPQLEANGNVAAYYSISNGQGATVREVGLLGFVGGPCTIAFEQSDTLTTGGGGGGSSGGSSGVIKGYNFSGYGQCRPLASDQACPQLANEVTDTCLDKGGRTYYCSDCSVMCSVPVN
jgi:hypothetical protein